jgi:hypothetical protein
MHAVADKIEVTCPQCGQDLRVPADSLGKQARCPSCSRLFAVSEPRAADEAISAAVVNSPEIGPGSNWTMQPQSPQSYSAASIPNPYEPSATTTATKNYNHGFGWEHRGWDKGMMGGLAMMAIAAVWFLVGLAGGIIFYYPPILFVIGLVGFIRGLFTGNVAGR